MSVSYIKTCQETLDRLLSLGIPHADAVQIFQKMDPNIVHVAIDEWKGEKLNVHRLFPDWAKLEMVIMELEGV